MTWRLTHNYVELLLAEGEPGNEAIVIDLMQSNTLYNHVCYI